MILVRRRSSRKLRSIRFVVRTCDLNNTKGEPTRSRSAAQILPPSGRPANQGFAGVATNDLVGGSIPSGPARRCRDSQCSVLGVPASSSLVGRRRPTVGGAGKAAVSLTWHGHDLLSQTAIRRRHHIIALLRHSYSISSSVFSFTCVEFPCAAGAVLRRA